MQLAAGSMSTAVPPRTISPGPWERLLGWHVAVVRAHSTLSCRHSLSAAPTVHMAEAGCGHGAALTQGRCRWLDGPWGQGEMGADGAGPWGRRKGSPSMILQARVTKWWRGSPLLLPRVLGVFLKGPVHHPVCWATQGSSWYYWGPRG